MWEKMSDILLMMFLLIYAYLVYDERQKWSYERFAAILAIFGAGMYFAMFLTKL